MSNRDDRLLWARRIGQQSWQFPQGGIREGETPEQALFRELKEEIGLGPEHVSIIGYTQDWLHYRLPDRLIRYDKQPLCIGQKQRWYLLRLTVADEQVRLDSSTKPEFDCWRWVSYWYPLEEVIAFKREVYTRALKELASLLPVE